MKDENKNKIAKVPVPPPQKKFGGPNIYRVTKIGLLCIFIFFGGIILWSAIAPLEIGAVMPGKVVVETYRKTIQHREGGIVQSINVEEGSNVQKGEVLIVLDNTKEKSTFELLQMQVNFLQAKLARLLAESAQSQTIIFPKSLLDQKSDPQIQTLIQGETSIYNARKELLTKIIEVLTERISQIKNQIESLRAQAVSSDKQLVLINEETDAVASLEARHLIARPKLLALEREQARLTGDRDQNLALIAQSEQKIGEVELQIIQTKQQETKEVVEDLQTTQAALLSNQEKLFAAKDTLDRTIIRSPISGIVVDLKLHTIGGVVTAGETLMQVVPVNDQLVIEAKVNPIDIDFVRSGLPAKVMFIGLPRRSSPTLNGTIEEVSADALTEERTGQSYYLTRVIISHEELSRLGNIKIYPGMPVQVLVITDKRSAIGYFIMPIRNSFFRAFRER
jgi:HlyD family type I secretion membrane fusion protein